MGEKRLIFRLQISVMTNVDSLKSKPIPIFKVLVVIDLIQFTCHLLLALKVARYSFSRVLPPLGGIDPEKLYRATLRIDGLKAMSLGFSCGKNLLRKVLPLIKNDNSQVLVELCSFLLFDAWLSSEIFSKYGCCRMGENNSE